MIRVRTFVTLNANTHSIAEAVSAFDADALRASGALSEVSADADGGDGDSNDADVQDAQG